MTLKSLLIVALAAAGTLAAPERLAAAEQSHGGLEVERPWARASLGAVKVGVAYLTIVNRGHGADRLIGLSTTVAGRAELHSTTMDQGVMKMRPVESLELAPGETVALEPGGLHVMLMGLQAPLREGEHFPLTLSFAEAGDMTVQVRIDSATASGPGEMDHANMDHGAHHGGHHGPPVEMTADDGPGLRLEVVADPENGWLLTLATENFTFAEDKANQPHEDGEGHAHLYVDGEKITRIYEETYRLERLTEGSHQIRVSLHANDHRHYEVDGEQVAAEVTVEAGPEETPESAYHIADLQILKRRVLGPNTLRVKEGEQVRLEWSSDEVTKLHLHGYDIKTDIERGDPTITTFEAHTAGRFPITSHGFGSDDHGHYTLLYLEVLPD